MQTGKNISPIEKIHDFLERYNTAICILMVALILVGGIGYSIYLGEQLRFLPDESDYFAIAQNLVKLGNYSINGVDPTAARPPGYPFVLYPLVYLGGGVVAARILNYALFAAALIWLNKLLIRTASRFAATLGLIFACGYGLFFFTAGVLYPQTLCGLLLIAAIDLLTRPEITLPNACVAGGALTLLILAVPTFIFVPFVFAAWMIIFRRPLRPLIAVGGIMLLVFGIWTWRNYTTFDTFFFISTHSGRVLLYGNSENTTPNAGAVADISKYELEAERLGMSDREADSYFYRSAIQYMLDHPGRTVIMYAAKFLNYFNFRNELVTKTESTLLRDLVMLVTYGPLLALCMIRLALFRKIPLAAYEYLWIALYLVNGLVYAVYITRIRFRMPFDWILILASAWFVSTLYSKYIRKDSVW